MKATRLSFGDELASLLSGRAPASSAAAGSPSLTPWHTRRAVDMVVAGWAWLAAKRRKQLSERRLRVLETVQLGEKRFVAVVDFDGAHFLIGGAATQVALLAKLDGATPGESS